MGVEIAWTELACTAQPTRLNDSSEGLLRQNDRDGSRCPFFLQRATTTSREPSSQDLMAQSTQPRMYPCRFAVDRTIRCASEA